MSFFFDGLKKQVQDELFKEVRPATLVEYIAQAVRIDDRQFTRRKMKKKNYPTQNQGSKPRYTSNTGRRRNQYNSTTYDTHAGPMESGAAQQEVVFLGHTIQPNEFRMERKKIEAVKDWPMPENLKEVQVFLGFANYHRRFIRDFGRIATPLMEFIRKEVSFTMSKRAQKAFNQIRNAILSEPALLDHVRSD